MTKKRKNLIIFLLVAIAYSIAISVFGQTCEVGYLEGSHEPLPSICNIDTLDIFATYAYLWPFMTAIVLVYGLIPIEGPTSNAINLAESINGVLTYTIYVAFNFLVILIIAKIVEIAKKIIKKYKKKSS